MESQGKGQEHRLKDGAGDKVLLPRDSLEPHKRTNSTFRLETHCCKVHSLTLSSLYTPIEGLGTKVFPGEAVSMRFYSCGSCHPQAGLGCMNMETALASLLFLPHKLLPQNSQSDTQKAVSKQAGYLPVLKGWYFRARSCSQDPRNRWQPLVLCWHSDLPCWGSAFPCPWVPRPALVLGSACLSPLPQPVGSW